jgi:hypothetical protein
MDTVTVTLVEFQTLITVSLPLWGASGRVAQGSTLLPELLLAGAAVDVNVTLTSSVGKAKGVFVGRGVCVGASVGGRAVLVGMAAWVCATIVNAAATAVLCTSAAFIVGAAGAPQALMIIMIAVITVRVANRFMFCENLLSI